MCYRTYFVIIYHLRSSSSYRLQVPAYRLATVVRRSFPVAVSILSEQPVSLYSARILPPQTSNNHFQTFCCNYPHIDFAFVDFVMTSGILATINCLFDLIIENNARMIWHVCSTNNIHIMNFHDNNSVQFHAKCAVLMDSCSRKTKHVQLKWFCFNRSIRFSAPKAALSVR